MPETAALLDRYPVVQPFGWMTYLPQAEGEEYAEARLPTLPLGQGVGGVYHAAGLAVSSFPDLTLTLTLTRSCSTTASSPPSSSSCSTCEGRCRRAAHLRAPSR